MPQQENGVNVPANPAVGQRIERADSSALTAPTTKTPIKPRSRRSLYGVKIRRKLTKTRDPALYAAIKSLERLTQHAIDVLDKLAGDVDFEPEPLDEDNADLEVEDGF